MKAQEWLDGNYLKAQRINIIEIELSKAANARNRISIEGEMDLSDFVNLKRLIIRRNGIIIDLNNLPSGLETIEYTAGTIWKGWSEEQLESNKSPWMLSKRKKGSGHVLDYQKWREVNTELLAETSISKENWFEKN